MTVSDGEYGRCGHAWGFELVTPQGIPGRRAAEAATEFGDGSEALSHLAKTYCCR